VRDRLLRKPLLLVETLEDRALLAAMLWINPAGGNWNDAANWQSATDSTDHHVPTASDDATLDAGPLEAPPSVSAASADVASLTVKGYTLNVSGPMTIAGALTLTATVPTPLFAIPASLSISGLATVGGDVSLDESSLALASASIAGDLSATAVNSPSTISVSDNLSIEGTTSLYQTAVTGTGVIQAQGKLITGAFVSPVQNPLAELFAGVTVEIMSAAEQLGNDGVELAAGARVVNEPTATYHMDSPSNILGDSSSTFENDGSLLADSSTTNDQTRIGCLFSQSSTGSITVTSGTLYLEGGATFKNGETPANALTLAGTLIANSGATIAMNTSDASPLSVNVPATVTLQGPGSVSIYDVALSLPGQVIANSPVAIGNTTITGDGVVTSNSVLTLGSSSSFSETAVYGSAIVNNGTATLAMGSSSIGLHFENGGRFDNAPGAVFTFLTDATISADFPSHGMFTNEGTVNKAAGATGLSAFLLNVVNKGTISLTNGSAYDFAGTLDNAGTIALGPGKLTVIMPFTQEPTGILDVAINGPAPATGFGQIFDPGLANLGGTLNVSLAPGYVPAAGTSIQVISSFSVSGMFATVNGLASANGTQLTPVASSNGLALQVPKSTSPRPTPVRVSGITGVAHSAAGVTSITIAFNAPVHTRSATRKSFYRLMGAVTKKLRTLFTRSLAVEQVVLASPTSVTVVLAQPYNGAVKVSVRPGVPATNGTKSGRSFSAVVQ
jgi:hypothetical protein